jgi:hypothetical protein
MGGVERWQNLDEEDRQGQAPGRRGFIRVAEKKGRRLFFRGLFCVYFLMR